MTTHGVAAFPLYWPLQYPRTVHRRSARFVVDFQTARTQLLTQLDRLHASNMVLSTNIPLRRDGLPAVPDREPVDPGVAVYFSRRTRKADGHLGGPTSFVIACDQFDRVRWNLRAIGATIEALRAIERHGSTSMLEQAFSGFAALPPATAAKPWREVLGFTGQLPTADMVRARVRGLALLNHPDVDGGDTERMSEINIAADAALREIG
jgi:hypothetical protein